MKRMLEPDGDGAVAPPPSRRRTLEADAHVVQLRMPPVSRLQMWWWVLPFISALSGYGAIDFIGDDHGLLSKLTSTVAVTTDFSGMGCAEMAGSAILTGLAKSGFALPAHKGLRYTRAGDVAPHCRSALLLHGSGPCAPEHVLGDMFDRIPPELLRTFQSLWSQAQSKTISSIHGGISKRQAILKGGQWFFQVVADRMFKAKLHTRSHCYRCDHDCSVFPEAPSSAWTGHIAGVAWPLFFSNHCVHAALDARAH